MTGGNSSDTLTGNSAANVLSGGMGWDTLNGGGGADTLNGNARKDLLNGDDGADQLFGGDDADVLNGGTGNDTLNGGNGWDVFKAGLSGGNDTVTDFSYLEDQLDFSAYGLNTYAAIMSHAQQAGANVVFTLEPDGHDHAAECRSDHTAFRQFHRVAKHHSVAWKRAGAGQLHRWPKYRRHVHSRRRQLPLCLEHLLDVPGNGQLEHLHQPWHDLVRCRAKQLRIQL